MKRVLLPLLAGVLALAQTESVLGISREQDLVRDVTDLFSAPTVLPPNNALRPNFGGTPIREPFQRDEGPDEETTAEKVSIGYYPWVVALIENQKTPQEGYICAGVIVAPNWALTAAHCTFNWVRRWPIDSEAYVLTGTETLVSPGPRFAVTKIVPHPDYDARRLANDLALVRFDAKGADVGPPLQLDGPPIQTQVGEIAQITGWGVSNTRLLERQQLESLQMIQVGIRSSGVCFNSLNYPQLKGKGVFCARSLLRFHDTCYRFGGAPIVMRDAKGERYLAGLVSWSAACPPDQRKPNAYLDVQAYVPWIKATIRANTRAAR